MQSSKEAQFAALFGPLPAYSEYKRGEHVSYRAYGRKQSGIIVWVAAPQRIAGKQEPAMYIIENEAIAGFPDMVAQSDIIVE